jgi:hypothetical protein
MVGGWASLIVRGGGAHKILGTHYPIAYSFSFPTYFCHLMTVSLTPYHYIDPGSGKGSFDPGSIDIEK